ncbi:GerAB/ArcD/ProY family transporter [Desulfofundulus salinus]|uniref:Spore gernimation protein n=1 Tax=Desulfofundulus salinus TaxID=2419843 RepID=A0A494WU50_9FIRM|nr:endospore germination permease [Desulfofundulus salinum]RKO66481.1 spore gernimation protein [Desulfofundulus salinum]
MLEQGKIDSKQAILLMISLVLPTAILTVPAITVKHARQDAWLSIIVATMAGLLIARLVVSLSLRFPGKTLFEYAEEILGKVPGKIVGLMYIWWFLHTNALIMDEFGAFLCTAQMPDTPVIVFFIVGIAVAAYAIRNGLEVLSRFNQLFLPLVLGLLLVVFILATKEMKVARLLPVFDKGAIAILKGAATPASWLGEIVAFAMIIPFLNKPKEAHRVAALATLFTGFFLLVSILVAITIFGPNVTGHWIFPTYNAVRAVSIANFLERLDTIIVAVWMFGGFAKVGVFYYAAVLGSAQWLGLKDYRPLVAPVGVILAALAVLCKNIVELLDFLAAVWPPYALSVFEVGMPLVLLIVALARGKGGKSVG